MSKLIQRFKEGKKLRKFGLGGISANIGTAFTLPSVAATTLVPKVLPAAPVLIPAAAGVGFLGGSAYGAYQGAKKLRNISPKSEYDKMSELEQKYPRAFKILRDDIKKLKGNTFNRLFLQDNSSETPKQNSLEKNSLEKSSLTTPQQLPNLYLKGFEHRKAEIDSKFGGVTSLQKILNKKYGIKVDGKWGKDTEAAYNQYLADTLSENIYNRLLEDNPVGAPSIHIPTSIAPKIEVPNFLNTQIPTNRIYQAKKGTKLISRNPIRNFLNRN